MRGVQSSISAFGHARRKSELHAEPTDEQLCEGSAGLGAKRSSHEDARQCLQEVGVTSRLGAARGVGTGVSPGIKTFPRPPRLTLSTGGRGNAHPQRGSSPTGEAGSQVLRPWPATHRPLAADGQNTEPRPRLKITEVRLVCMSRAPRRREASVKPMYGFFWWIRKNTVTLETFRISQLYKTELRLMLKTP